MVNFSTSTSPKLGRRAAATPAATLKAFPRRGPRALSCYLARSLAVVPSFEGPFQDSVSFCLSRFVSRICTRSRTE